MSVTSLIRFCVKPGREGDFEEAFEKSGMLRRPRGVEGFVSAELLQNRSEPGDYYVIAKWTSAEAYASWQELSLAGGDAVAVAGLLDTLTDPAPGKLFEAIATSERD